MELHDAIMGRRMVRSYDPDQTVPRSTVDNLINYAIRAPSAGHTQGWRFLVLDDITSRESFWSAAATGEADRWLTRMRQAPVLIICFSDEQAYLDRYAEADKGWSDRDPDRWPVPYWHIDTGMAAMILLLAAEDAGLGACFFGVPRTAWAELFARFSIPSRLTPIGVVSLGHPAPDLRSPSLRRGRRELADVRRYGAFDPED
jgi:nitroreductase